MKNCKTNMITMRKIKFRAKRSDDGKWVFGDLTHEYRITRDKDIPCIRVARYNIDESSIGQFTGLLDKNGKEIYEGDIYRYDNPDSINEVSYCAGGGFAGFDLTPAIHSENRLLDVEVIGNIHDNPELLKGGNDEND